MLNFKVDALEFGAIAKTCIKGLNSKDPNSQIVFTINEDDSTLTIQCSSQTAFFKGSLRVRDLELEDQLQFAVDGEQLKTILQIIPAANISITFELSPSGRQFTLKDGTSKLKLPVFENVFAYHQEEIEKISEVTASEFIKNITNLSKFLENDSLSQDSQTSCLHIFAGDQLKFMGTNGISIAEVTENHNKLFDNEEEVVVLLRTPQISLLSNSFETDEVLTLIHTNNLFGYVDSKGVIALVSKADMSPVYYEMLKDRVSDKQSITLDSSSFRRAVESLSKLCVTSDEITLEITEDSIIAKNDNEDDMQIISSTINCEPTTLKFLKQSLQPVHNLLSSNFQMTFDEDPILIKFNVLTNDDEVDENIFIGVTLND